MSNTIKELKCEINDKLIGNGWNTTHELVKVIEIQVVVTGTDEYKNQFVIRLLEAFRNHNDI